MLTPREVAANRFAAVGSMPARVLGFAPADYDDLRRRRVEALRAALRALRAAQGTPQIVVGEWGDDLLQAQAVRIEAQLEKECAERDAALETQRFTRGVRPGQGA